MHRNSAEESSKLSKMHDILALRMISKSEARSSKLFSQVRSLRPWNALAIVIKSSTKKQFLVSAGLDNPPKMAEAWSATPKLKGSGWLLMTMCAKLVRSPRLTVTYTYSSFVEMPSKPLETFAMTFFVVDVEFRRKLRTTLTRHEILIGLILAVFAVVSMSGLDLFRGPQIRDHETLPNLAQIQGPGVDIIGTNRHRTRLHTSHRGRPTTAPQVQDPSATDPCRMIKDESGHDLAPRPVDGPIRIGKGDKTRGRILPPQIRVRSEEMESKFGGERVLEAIK
eukprot:TCALIF_07072-PA protein Name:"Protein of unknown function" AED:0.75 eAED:0.76 QI:0/0/0/0.33/1/1/6/0/280